MIEALLVKNVSYAYGAKLALDDVSFSLAAGQFCALLGPNGAGKSTLFSLLTRLERAHSGAIAVRGAALSRATLAHLGIVFQQPTLDLDLTVAHNMSYFAALQGLTGKTAKMGIEAALLRMNMLDRAAEKVSTLNGGHRRRMEIARALIHNPKVLLLDEATVGLDAASRLAITRHVHDLAGAGLAVLWATHLVDEIAPEDETIILHQGRVLLQDSAANIAAESTLTERFLEMTSERPGE